MSGREMRSAWGLQVEEASMHLTEQLLNGFGILYWQV